MHDLENVLKNVKNKKLLVIFPHPDDETMAAGGLLIKAQNLGFETTVCILTKGGAGQLHIHPRGKTTKQVREIELKKATKMLGVNNLILFDFDDGKLKTQKAAWSKEVQETLKAVKPGVLVTFDPSGWTGHPDHIVLSNTLRDITKNILPKALLLYVSTPKPLRHKWMNPKILDYAVEPTHSLKLNGAWIKKWRAARTYRSQRFTDSRLKPVILMILLNRIEWYHKVDYKKNYKFKFVEFNI